MSEASVQSQRAHHGVKQAPGSSQSRSQASPFEALLGTTAPDAGAEKAPPPDRSAKPDRAAPAKNANDPQSQPDRPAAASDTQTDTPDAKTDKTSDAKPETEAATTDAPIEPDADAAETVTADGIAVVIDATAQPAAPQPVAAPVSAPAIPETAQAPADDTSDIVPVAAKPVGETIPADLAPKPDVPSTDAADEAPAQTTAPAAIDAAPADEQTDKTKPQIAKTPDAKPADAPATDKTAAQPAANADGDTDAAQQKDAAPADKKSAPASVHADAKPDAPAKPKADPDTARNPLDLTPREHAAHTDASAAQTATAGTTQTPAAHGTSNISSPAQATQIATAVPVTGIAVEIAAQSRAGKNRFEIRLDPPELGRIDVRLDVDKDGNVTSRLVIDRSETYDLLRRDAQQLERALNQAGLKTSDNALEFQLRDQGLAQNGNNGRGGERDRPQIIIPDEQSSVVDAARGYGRMLGLGNGLDISV